MLLDLFFIFLLLIVLFGVKTVKPLSSFNDDYMSLKSCNSYKGLFALIVILHHISQRVSIGILPPDFTRVGYLAVSVFFFLSGYGLQKKNLSDKTYSNGFLLKRIPAILIPYTIMTLLYWGIYALLGDVRPISSVWHNFIKNGDPIVWFSWYVVCILAFYFTFFVLMKISKSNKKAMILGSVIYYVLYVIICRALNFGLWWYSTALILVFGIFYASYEAPILEFLKKNYLKILIPVLLISYVLAKFKWNIYWLLPSLRTELLLVIILSVLFVSVFFILMLKIDLKNKILTFLGKISFELYMTQGAIMLLTKNRLLHIDNDFYWAILVVFGSLASAYLLNKLFSSVLKKYSFLVAKTAKK